MRNIYTAFFLIAMSHVLGFSAFAREDYTDMKTLTGKFILSGKTPHDPPPGEPSNTHLMMYLTGESAKTLWNAMKVKPRFDVCADDGTLSKNIGAMQCSQSHDKKKFQCWFSIDIKNQKIASGWVC